MSRAVLANSFEVLGLLPTSAGSEVTRRVVELGERHARGESGPTPGEIADAARRLRDPFLRIVECVFSSESQVYGCRKAVALLRKALSRESDKGAITEAHQAWQVLISGADFPREVARLGKRWRRRSWADAVKRLVPRAILEAHARVGQEFLDSGDLNCARLQAQAIVDSPLGDQFARRSALAEMYAKELHPLAERLEKAESRLKEALAAAAPINERLSSAREILESALSETAVDEVRVSKTSPEAAGLIRDALARQRRSFALVVARTGQTAHETAEELRRAANLAASPELRKSLEREASDPEGAVGVDEALTIARGGNPQKAWRQIGSMRRRSKDPGRKAWLDEVRKTPLPWLAPARRQPTCFAVLGCGLGFSGHRALGPEGDFSSAWGLVLFGLPVATISVCLRRPARNVGPDRRPVTIGRLPLAFRPAQWKALASRVLVAMAVALFAAFGLEWWINQREHRMLSRAQDAIASGQLRDVAEELGRGSNDAGPVIRWRRNRTLRAWLTSELERLTSPEDARDFLERARLVMGDDRPENLAPASMLVLYTRPITGPADWMNGELEAKCLQRVSSLPVTRLPIGGGPVWTKEVEPWNQGAVWTADLVDWTLRSCPGVGKRRSEVLRELALRFDSPHLWSRVVQEAQIESRVIADDVARLGTFLETSRYTDWAAHFRIYARSAAPSDAERILNLRARGIWIGYDYGSELDSIMDLFPEPLRNLKSLGVPTGDRDSLSPARRAIFDLGARHRSVMKRAMAAMGGFDVLGINEVLVEFPDLIRDVPEDEFLPEIYGLLLNFMGKSGEAIAFAEPRRFPGRARVLAPAYLKENRFEEALRVLQTASQESLPRIRTLQVEWRSALEKEVARVRADLKGEPPEDPRKRWICKNDAGSMFRSQEEWVQAAAYWGGKMSIWRLRWLLEDTHLCALQMLGEVLLAAWLRTGALGDQAQGAVALLDEMVSWLGRSMMSIDPLPLQACGRALLSGESVAAMSDRLYTAGLDQQLAELAVLCRTGGLRDDAALCYERAWECAPEKRKRVYALASLGLATTPQSRMDWLRRTGGQEAEFAGRAARIEEYLSEGRWSEVAAVAEQGHRMATRMEGMKDIKVGEAAWALIAWIAIGDRKWLDAGADAITQHLERTPVRGVTDLRVALRILLARADVDLSGEALPADAMHGSVSMDWIEFSDARARPLELSTQARANSDLSNAETAARELLELVAGDEEALRALQFIAEIQDDPSKIPLPASSSEPKSETPEPSRSPDLPAAPDPLASPKPSSLLMIDRALEAPDLAASSPARACLLYRRAVVRVLIDRGQSVESLERSLADLKESLSIRESLRASDAQISLLILRGLTHLPDSAGWSEETVAAINSSPLFALAVRASVHPKEVAWLSSQSDFLDAATTAAKRLQSASSRASIEAFAALRIAGDRSVDKAGTRLVNEAITINVRKLLADLDPRDPGSAFAKWLILDLQEGREAAAKFARESPLRELFEALCRE